MLESLKLFHEPNDIIEIRIIGRVTTSGYFSDFEKAANEAKKYDGKANVYFVLNKVKAACYHRDNRDKLIDKATNTSDNDIDSRRWILLDFDPKRAAKTSSTDSEKLEAYEAMKNAAKFLRSKGFKAPVIADSGNGYHLLYKVDMPNDNEHKKLVETFLKAIDMLFSFNTVDIDKAVFNASRITKLYGTMAVKGANTKERPHRRSKIEHIPKHLEVTEVSKIANIAKLLPKPQNNSIGEFDLKNFFSKHGIQVSQERSWDSGNKYVLEQCPFDSAHGKDSAVIQLNSGALSFHCFHNGCSANGWKEFRNLYEPESQRQEYNPTHNTRHKKQINLSPVTPKEMSPDIKAILDKAKNLSGVKQFDRKNIEVYQTGIETLDRQMEVLFGKLGIVTGVNGSGKSTFLGQLMLEALEQNHKVFTFSGELLASEFQYWIDLQAAGSSNLTSKTSKLGKQYFEINKEAVEKIHDWYSEKFFLYDNDQSMKYEDLLKTIDAYRVHKNCRVIFLDNYMTIDVSDLHDKELQAQTDFIWSLSKYCKKHNVLIFLVVHPKKIYEGICQKQDVLGSGNFSNAIDFMYIVHRVNETFKTHLAKRKISKSMQNVLENASNVVEIGKDRWSGREGLNIPLRYAEDSKRLSDANSLHVKTKRYSWEYDNEPF